MQPSKLCGLCCHKSSDHDMRKFMPAMDYLIRMEILDTVTTNHSPGMIIVNSNKWDDYELACSEIVQRAIAQTSTATGEELFSITWRKIASPREGSALYTYALVIDVDDLLCQGLVDMLGTGARYEQPAREPLDLELAIISSATLKRLHPGRARSNDKTPE